MTLQPGARLGPYEILSALGAGGMGEVYRAKDTRLKRDVALKILPDTLAQDTDRLARFQREAELLATLSHPHIAAIYGLEESNGARALVLELVEGPTLADRIAQGAILLDEARRIARQIAEALEAAHEQGVIHRDLKPANIKVRPDGTVKVLDFGLAKIAEAPAASGAAAPSQSPTITTPAMMTGVGVILGTAAYMSPEQAKGQLADKRSDVWAFGAVFYEMLTAKRAFEGDDIGDTLATVLKGEPDWSALPRDLPASVRALVEGCLKKDRRQRISDISAAVFVLSQPTLTSSDAVSPRLSRALPSTSPWRRLMAHGAPPIVAALVAGTVVWYVVRPVTPRVVRTTLNTTGAASISIGNTGDPDFTVTPDGSKIVYIGNNSTQLFVRALDTLDPIAIATGVALRQPFVSPDGQWVGFVDGGTVMKKVAITGGPPAVIAQIDAPRGMTWTPDDSIIFATNASATGLLRVPATGGTPVVLTKPDASKGETDHLWPELLPGGRSVLFTITAPGGLDTASIAVLDLRTGSQQVILRGGSHAQYVSGGYLVYGVAGTLRAIPFDLQRLAAQGASVPVVPRLVASPFGAFDYRVTSDGTLVYLDAPLVAMGIAGRRMVWVDRGGKEESLGVPPRLYNYPSISPDGTRVAVSLNDQERDIWIWDLRRGPPLTRLTFDAGVDTNPIWAADGRHIVFSSDQAGGPRNLWWQVADKTSAAERLTTSANLQFPTSIAPNGDVLFVEVTTSTGADIMRLPLAGDRRPVPLLQTKDLERNAVVSPDGHWMAYESDSAGHMEIFVRPYPNTGVGQSQISTDGGAKPLWAPNGKELFYLALDGTMMTVPVTASPAAWSHGTPARLFDSRISVATSVGRTYDVSRDGRFLIIRGLGADRPNELPSFIVVQHFDEELKARVPTK